MADQPQPPSQELLQEKLAAFDNVPLFMKSLPEDGDDVALQALQELVYEGTPDENAQNFKEQGNDYFKGKRYREALGFYTQGLDAQPTDTKLRESLLCNRAACNLELQNYGKVLKDCSDAIKLNPKASKAYFRSATALLKLERLEEALDCLDVLRTFFEDDAGVTALRERVTKAIEAKERKEKEVQARLKKAQEEKRKMDNAFQVS
ncbi:hypothetical protein HGRIS_014947 [Hohenbuehelia grisea]|uniref:Tetratricopeptide repeat protein n=1 Tax=Hohenbuehelia grisea TaxID=104357 RepID=A0ABR3J0Y4_9AGAR